jgi:hypothetical protein
VNSPDAALQTAESTSDDYQRQLRTREFRFFERKLFGPGSSADVAELYVKACESVFAGVPAGAASAYDEFILSAIHEELDIEALELALRRKLRRNLLSQHVAVFLYVLEIHSAHYSKFHNDRRSRTAAYFALSFHVFRSIWKLLQGQMILTRRAESYWRPLEPVLPGDENG